MSPGLLLGSARAIALALALAAGTVPPEASLPIPEVLPAPPFVTQPANPGRGKRPPLLVRVSAQRNEITDTDRWLAANALEVPMVDAAEPTAAADGVPTRLAGEPLVRVIRQWPQAFAIYGRSGGHLLLVLDGEGRPVTALDFGTYAHAPMGTAEERSLFAQSIVWVAERDGILYVSHAHRTYASSTGGMNAYVSAIALASRRLLWRSAPQVANARSFELVGDTLVTGYGFTDEPDFLYVLDRRTGATLERVSLRTGPEWILRRGESLFVRTYDTDYVFRITAPR